MGSETNCTDCVFYVWNDNEGEFTSEKYLPQEQQDLPLFATMTFLIGRYSVVCGAKWAKREDMPTLFLKSRIALDPPKRRSILEKTKPKIIKHSDFPNMS